MLWTTDYIGASKTDRLYYVNRRPARNVVRRYYSAYNGWPHGLLEDDLQIKVVLDASEQDYISLAETAENCAVFKYGNQVHYLPICWLQAADTWGYQDIRCLGIWLESLHISVTDICAGCLRRVFRATQQCRPLDNGCALPFCLTPGALFNPPEFASYYASHRPSWGWPIENFKPINELCRKAAATVDDVLPKSMRPLGYRKKR